MSTNPYIPHLATIKEVKELTDDTKNLRIAFDDRKIRKSWTFKPGQFVEVSAFGFGEVPISIASSPTLQGCFELAIRNSGRVTSAFHSMEAGDKIGVRGPYGNWWPYDRLLGKDVTVIAGGIGLAACSNVLRYLIDKRSDYGELQLLYGAVIPDRLVFTDEYEKWREAGVDVNITVDQRVGDWKGNVGLVTQLFNEQLAPELEKVEIPSNAAVFVCGPAVMIHFCCLDLVKLGFNTEKIYVSLEGHMKCGVGKCGHCNIGPKYVCRDGPIFSHAQVEEIEGYKKTT